jgi:hypothetical protein
MFKHILCAALFVALLAGIALIGEPYLNQDVLMAMTVQLSVAVRNAMLDAIETAVGTSAVIKLKTGAPPANCAAADSGTVVATINLASDWMSAASSGSKAFSSTPLTDSSADNTGTLAHYRVYASDGATCHEQGTITATGGGGDMTVDNTSVVAGQSVSITSWTQNMSGHA